MHAAQHLHEDIDVACGLGHDHVALALVGKLLRCVQADTRGTRHIENQRIQLATIETARRCHLVALLCQINGRQHRLARVAVVHCQVAPGDFRHREPGARNLSTHPVDGRHRNVDGQAVNDLLRMVVGLSCDGVQLRERDVLLGLVTGGQHHIDDPAALQGAR